MCDIIFGLIIFGLTKLYHIMKLMAFSLLACCCFSACQSSSNTALEGTYRLVESTTIKGSDTSFVKVDPTRTEMIKIFNKNHFSFFNHDLAKGEDSTALFVAGAGTYTFNGSDYTENLDFCSYRPWEGKQFNFALHLKGDTLIQQGEEDIPELGIKQFIIEKYVRIP